MNARDFRGRSALMYAARYSGYPDLILFLATAGARLDVTGPEGKTALIWAVIDNTCTEVISALLMTGADPQIADASGKTAIDYAQSVDRLGGTKAFEDLANASPCRCCWGGQLHDQGTE